MRWLIQWAFINPVFFFGLWISIIMFFVSFGAKTSLLRVGSGLLLAFSIVWLISSRSIMLSGLYKQTQYEHVPELVAITEMRDASYMEAQENFRDQNPEARFSFHDLDYVRGEWRADFSPDAGITPLWMKTSGFFVYRPGEADPVVIRRQKMPFAEGGWLFNSDKFYIYNKAVFTRYMEIIYVEDPDTGGFMGVVSLIGRRGIARVPFLTRVMIIHSDGKYEMLSPAQAEEDERLEGVQLTPEWLAKQRTLAYGWREGFWAGVFTRKGRITVQTSMVNTENAAPYHLRTGEGMMWFTPFAPQGKESLKGVAMEASELTDGKIRIWQLSDDQAWKGVDALATEVKATERERDINWLRVSKVEGGEARSGDTDIVELLPCPRKTNDTTRLYACGYVAFDPPKTTRFFTIIDVQTLEVMNDVRTVEEVNRWLKGEVELESTTSSSPPAEAADTECSNPTGLSEKQLIRCIKLFAEELENR